MRFKILIKLFVLCLSSYLMNSCDETQTSSSAFSGRSSLGAASIADPSLRETAIRACTDRNGFRIRGCDINNINSNSGMLHAPNRCVDGNCPEAHVDRTPSRPAADLSDVEGFTPITSAEGDRAKAGTMIYDKQSGTTTSLLGPPPRRSTHDCGQGVRKLVKQLYGDEIRGHGHQWYDKLSSNPDYVKVDCQPEECPSGAILVYDHHQPSPVNNGTGDQYGHVEVVLENSNGVREACSDYCSSRTFGGNAKRRRLFQGAFVRVNR